MGYSLAFRGRAGATTAIRRCPVRLSGAVDIFCNLPSPKWTRIDFGGGDSVWGWQKRRNQGIICCGSISRESRLDDGNSQVINAFVRGGR